MESIEREVLTARYRISVHAELVDQPCLADARLAGDEHELGTPG